MPTVITVENLGKKYTISHQQREEYSSMRYVITNGVPTNDVWIAASAMQHGRTLATLDSHFKYITGLSLQPALERMQP